MPKAIIRIYSTFYHAQTETEFVPVLDPNTGCHIGLADVSDAVAKKMSKNPVFEIVSDEDFAAAIRPAPEPEEPAQIQTGDPLTDAGANKTVKSADKNPPPPPPPASK